MTRDDDDTIRDQLAEYLRIHPDTSAIEAVGHVGADPSRWVDPVRDALAADRPHAALATTAEEDGRTDTDPAREELDVDPDGTDADTSEPPERGEEDPAPDRSTPGVDAERSGSETPKPTDSTDLNQQITPVDPPVLVNNDAPTGWGDADFTTTRPDTYPPTLLDREQWMGRAGEDGKLPFAPWGDKDPDDADPDDSPRWEWGRAENYVDGDTVAIAEDDPRLDGRAFIQLERDPFAFVDGDDVRDPDTGEVHPAFIALLEHLGGTYADVSTSGAGVHAPYYAPDGLPIDGKGQATFEIDTEPWGSNDSPPTVEIYANKRVCVTTGDHVDGTPLDLAEWDADALRSILEANGYDDKPDVSHDTDRDRPDLDGYDPDAVGAEDTAEDVRDVLKAVDRLRPSDLPLRSRRTGEDSTGWSTWDPSYRSSESGESVHSPPDEPVFHDHKAGESYGILGLFAAEEGIIREPWDRLEGSDWWDAVDAARDAGAPIPSFDAADGERTTQAQYPIETCEPPVYDPDTFDRRERWDNLQSNRYDAVLDHDGVSIWNDPAGSGKTTNAALGALQRDRNVALLFDKHEKAREAQTDDALPDWFDPYHLKGAEQKRHARCMDADHAGETCSEHGHTENCPSMCPVKDLDPDHETRRRYDAVAREVGDVKAHLLLADDLPGHDDDGRCKWVDQFEEVDAAAHVVGVHEYQRLKTVRDGRDVIVDESPSSLRETTHVDIEGLVRTASALADLADVLPRDDATQYTARAFADFVDDLVDAVTRDATLDDLDAPAVIWNAYESYDAAAGNYVEREEPTEEWHIAEALAQLKVAYSETILARIKRGEWGGTPVGLDAVITAAGEAGLSNGAVRAAVAAPTILDSCPWCSSPLEAHNGARVCGSDTCDWSEHGHTITQRGAERARALAYLDDGPAGVRFEQLPLTSDLPSDPLVLDATATPSRVALLYGADSDAVEVSGADDLRANMRVTQVLDGQYHANTIEKGDTARERIQTTIDKASEIHEKPLFVLKKGLRELFDFPAHAEILHYHAARGLNRNDCDAVVCIGAPHPNVPDLKREAELLAQGADTRVGGEEHSTRRDAPNPPVYRILNFEDDDGRGRAVPTKHYTGLVGDLFRETREKEIQQDIHRARPLLAEETVDVYLLTNVPTDVRVDTVCSFEELAEPLQALLPIRDGALEFLGTIERVAAGDGPDGFRAEQLVETTADGTLSHKVGEYHRLARLSGLDVTERTVRNYIGDLEAVGLLEAETYERRAGVSYTADRSTLKTALSILSNNAGFKVAARRRLRANIDKADSVTEWLDWARAVFGLAGDRCGLDPPPDSAV